MSLSTGIFLIHSRQLISWNFSVLFWWELGIQSWGSCCRCPVNLILHKEVKTPRLAQLSHMHHHEPISTAVHFVENFNSW